MFYLFSYHIYYKLTYLYWFFVLFLIFFNSHIASLVKKYFENKEVIDFWSVPKIFFSTLFSAAFMYFYPWPSNVFVCFFQVFPEEEKAHSIIILLACSIFLLWLGRSNFSSLKYSYVSILSGDNADIFAASMLISYYNFPSLILPLIDMLIPCHVNLPRVRENLLKNK